MATNKLDEISLSIGALKNSSEMMTKLFDQHCADDDRRHEQNLEAFRDMNRALAELTVILKPIADTVALWKPIIEGVQRSRWQLAGAMIIVSGLMAALGLLLWTFAGKIIAGLYWLIVSKP